MAIIGHAPDDPEDRFLTSPAPIADHAVLRGPVSQLRIEDIQLFRWLSTVVASGGLSPVGVELPLSDPPDRVIVSGAERWGVELTVLTLEDLRSDLGWTRRLADLLTSALRQSQHHEHLRGRAVLVGPLNGVKVDGDPARLVAPIVAALTEDRGGFSPQVPGTFVDLPEQLPPEAMAVLNAGTYDDVPPVSVRATAHGIPGELVAFASLQVNIRYQEIWELLCGRVQRKDVPENDVLVISCGLPDKRGYVCEGDRWVYSVLRELHEGGRGLVPVPTHLLSVSVQDFQSGEIVEVYRKSGASVPLPPDGGPAPTT